MKKYIKSSIKNNIDKIRILRSEKNEKNKFKDKRRNKIYSQVTLTVNQKNEIDQIYKKNYGKKIPYTWHRHFTAYTGKFDKYYFPELLYIPEFEYFMNLDKSYCYAFGDKNVLPIIAQNANVKMPNIIVSCTYGLYRNNKYEEINKNEVIDILRNIGECFAKPSVDSCSGNGCMLLKIKDGKDEKNNKTIYEILDKLGDNFVIQKRIKCHNSISNIYPDSVNTFRIITYRWKNEVKYIPSIMRIGQGGNYLDNAHAGGMFIAIDNDGTLHKTAYTEFKNEFAEHPDTKLKFEGYKIELFPRVLESAIKMHKAIPQIGVVNWDYTIDESGNPLLIEANLNGGSIWLSQMAHGKGPFGELTPEVLKWLKLMKQSKIEDRYKHKFGNIKGD